MPAAMGRGEDSREGSGSVVLHPLAVINVSDHFTRFSAMRLFPEAVARNAAADDMLPVPLAGCVRVLGILLGDQVGRTVEICHSFELPSTMTPDGRTEIDAAFMHVRIDQYRQIFPSYAVVGWYCTGAAVTPEDLRLHTEVFSSLNEAPILLMVNTDACTSAFGDRSGLGGTAGAASSSEMTSDSMFQSKQPVQTPAAAMVTYQMELKMVDGVPTTMLLPVAYRLASADSERIAVDHVSRHAVPGGGEGASGTTMHLATLRRSIRMLGSRIDVLVRFLEATANGDIPKDHALLRKVAGVCARLPAMDSADFSRAFEEEHLDAMVVSYLSGVTKSLCSMHDVVDMFNRLSDWRSPAAGPRGRSSRRRGERMGTGDAYSGASMADPFL